MGLQEITAWKEHSALLFAATHLFLRAHEGSGGVEKTTLFLIDEQLEIGNPKRTDFRLCLG